MNPVLVRLDFQCRQRNNGLGLLRCAVVIWRCEQILLVNAASISFYFQMFAAIVSIPSVEYLIFRFNRSDIAEFLFIFAQVVRQSIDDALQMARAHDDSGNQMNTARRVEQPVYDELFGAVGDNYVIAVTASRLFVAGVDLDLLRLLRLICHAVLLWVTESEWCQFPRFL